MQRKIDYPEYPLANRTKLAYKWIPNNCKNLLDVGCAFGYATRFFENKCKKVYGIDPNQNFINLAKARYSSLKKTKFIRNSLETTQFKNNFFDIIIMNDVLEHLNDEKSAMNNLFRMLKSGGILIITLPHTGLFSFMDTDNYVYFLRNKFPKFFVSLYRLLNGRDVPKINPGYKNKHKHYSVKDIKNLLNDSKFKNNYQILKIFKSGLFWGALYSNLNLIFNQFPYKKLNKFFLFPFYLLSEIDYRIPYGSFSYHLALKIIKN